MTKPRRLHTPSRDSCHRQQHPEVHIANLNPAVLDLAARGVLNKHIAADNQHTSQIVGLQPSKGWAWASPEREWPYRLVAQLARTEESAKRAILRKDPSAKRGAAHQLLEMDQEVARLAAAKLKAQRIAGEKAREAAQLEKSCSALKGRLKAVMHVRTPVTASMLTQGIQPRY